MEFVKSALHGWYSEHLSKDLARQIRRDDLKPTDETDRPLDGDTETQSAALAAREPLALPEGIVLVEGEPILDRKSAFVGRACAITDSSQVSSLHWSKQRAHATAFQDSQCS